MTSDLTTNAAEIRAGLADRLCEHVQSRGGLEAALKLIIAIREGTECGNSLKVAQEALGARAPLGEE